MICFKLLGFFDRNEGISTLVPRASLYWARFPRSGTFPTLCTQISQWKFADDLRT